ncbi:conserved protein of unknown function [Methylorubrum extorquens]|uniref:Uncharacterized protein n=1 Tax=Methylorubrum extorquens TaxID=408 RepID=A0A2N9AMA8_METEX|nr:conserved protein of unknown function [Methylorubrum extorquens]
MEKGNATHGLSETYTPFLNRPRPGDEMACSAL